MQKRILELDGLRAFAIMSVVGVHATQKWLPGGFIGVDIFFVISGFIITRLLLQEHADTGRISIRKFYLRRIRRIWPAFLIFLSAVAMVQVSQNYLAAAPDSHWYENDFFAAANIMNWMCALGISGGGVLTHTWSLSTEEQFYLIWPILLIVLLRYIEKTKIVYVLIFLAAACFLWRFHLVLDGESGAETYFPFDTRADSLIVGCVLAIYGVENITGPLTQLFVPACLTLVLFDFVVKWNSPFVNSFGFTVAALCAAVLVRSAVYPDRLTQALFGNKIAVWVGRRSYSLYLWNFPLVIWCSALPLKHAVAVVMGSAMSFVFADLSYRYVEFPFLKGPIRQSGTAAFGVDR